jgi:hypothetical protein
MDGELLSDTFVELTATISLLHERSVRHSDALNELQTALNSRVVIEQALP